MSQCGNDTSSSVKRSRAVVPESEHASPNNTRGLQNFFSHSCFHGIHSTAMTRVTFGLGKCAGCAVSMKLSIALWPRSLPEKMLASLSPLVPMPLTQTATARAAQAGMLSNTDLETLATTVSSSSSSSMMASFGIADFAGLSKSHDAFDTPRRTCGIESNNPEQVATALNVLAEDTTSKAWYKVFVI